MQAFSGYSQEQAREFAARWLPAWTGNDPERLLSFYSDDTFYSDPSLPAGIRGRDALRAYFTKLLRQYPDWVWTQTHSLPMQDGFVNYWHAHIPLVGKPSLDIDGVCLVHLREGLIFRNEVFFDRPAFFRH